MTSRLVKKEGKYYIGLFLNIDISQSAPIYLIEVFIPNLASLGVVERFLLNEK